MREILIVKYKNPCSTGCCCFCEESYKEEEVDKLTVLDLLDTKANISLDDIRSDDGGVIYEPDEPCDYIEKRWWGNGGFGVTRCCWPHNCDNSDDLVMHGFVGRPNYYYYVPPYYYRFGCCSGDSERVYLDDFNIDSDDPFTCNGQDYSDKDFMFFFTFYAMDKLPAFDFLLFNEDGSPFNELPI